MNRTKTILRLALHETQSNHEDSPIAVEEQMEILHSVPSSPMGSPMTFSHTEVKRESPLTTEQRETIAEMENLGFNGDDFNVPILYSNKLPLSVFRTNKDYELLESSVPSIEKQLTPLFTPVASIHSIGSPSIIKTSENPLNENLPTFIDDSNDSVADPNYQPEDEEIQCSPMSPITSSSLVQMKQTVSITNPQEIEESPTLESNLDGMENLGFNGDDFNVPILYSNKSPLSVFRTNKDYELLESSVPSIEKQLTPLFTPVASIHSIGSPSIIETSENPHNENLSTFIDDSDDSVADPNYQPNDEEIQCSPMSPITSSSLVQIEQPVSITNPQEIEESPTLESNLDRQKVKRCKRKIPENWKKNIRKTKKNCGETYISRQGKNLPAKKCGNENCKCQRACHTKIDNSTRKNIHLSFWGLGSIERQRDFIVSNVVSTEATGSRVANSRRKFTLNYSFKINSETVNVCQPFFLRTLDISDKMVRTALKKARRGVGNIPSPDKRGHHIPCNKFSEDNIKFANDHIDSFPKVPSHWCRKDTKKIYLETILNKEKMYELYKQQCLEKHKKPIGKTSYKELILNKNIGFHKPRKDQCWCNKYEQLTEEEQKAKQEEYEEHVNRKYYAQEEKTSDKIKAIEDSRSHVCTFDFEAVLYCPLVLGKPVFYKRKLGSMNFTIHNAATKQGYCYFWPEYEGNRGSNEVSTCLYNYISNLSNVDHLILFSDCCPGQNRNSVLVAMFNYIITSPDNEIRVIDYKFLEPGHTYMECDNMHSTIERASEYAKIYIPDDWQNVIRLARKDNPYNVQVMEHTDFLDFKSLRSTIIPNTMKATDGTVLQWANVRWLRFNKNIPHSLFFKYDYWEEFKEVKLKERVTRSAHNSNLAKLYPGQILLKQAKHKDLMEMCRDGTITKNHNYYYEKLPVQSVSGSLPQTRPRQDDDELELSATRASYLRRRSGKKN
ncbi:unnamed protein product [Pieris macdunnoughi]|uniref:DUF7869 domain-containing protein n=1 Tax=Pieris macdunnoughi TaxID=345717 RepID=A0A821XMB5_9NEOP|nr:unnamed protein product [Pieris macdunnoughi]